MLSAIREFDRWQIIKKNKNLFGYNYRRAIKTGKVTTVIDIDEKRFDNLPIEDYFSSKKLKYLFRDGPSNGLNQTPTVKIVETKKTFVNKIKK